MIATPGAMVAVTGVVTATAMAHMTAGVGVVELVVDAVVAQVTARALST